MTFIETHQAPPLAMEAVATKLRDFVVEELLYASDVDELGVDDELLGSGLLDSMGAAQLMVYIEENFAIQFEPQDLTFDNFNSVSALAALVAARS